MGVKVRDRKSGNVFDVEPDEAVQVVLGGNAELVDRSVAVLDPSGKAGSIPADQLRAALERGFTLTTPEAGLEHEKDRYYNQTSQQLLGAAEAWGRGSSAGLTDVLGLALGEDMEAKRERQERGGATTTALEILPQAAAAVLTGPAMGTVGRGTAIAAELIEGMVAGAGVAASDAALQGEYASPEDLFAGAGSGAMLSLGGRFAGEGLGALLSKGGKASKGAVSRLLKGGEGAGEEVSEELVGELTRRQILKDPELRQIPLDPAAARRSIVNPVVAEGRALKKQLSRVEDLLEQESGSLRRVEFGEADPEYAKVYIGSIGDVTRRGLNDLAERAPAVRNRAAQIRDEVSEALAQRSPAKAYAKLDRVSSKLGRYAKELEASRDIAHVEAAMDVRSIQQALDDTLDDTRIFGDAIRGRQAAKNAETRVAVARADAPAGLHGDAMNPAEVMGMARRGELDEATKARLDAVEVLARERELPPAVQREIDKLRQQSQRSVDELKKHSRKAEALELIEKAGKDEASLSMVREVGGVLGAGSIAGSLAAGTGLGGLVTAAGLGVQALTRPNSMLHAAARIVDAAHSIKAGRAQRVTKFIEGAKRGAKAVKSGAQSAAPRVTRAMGLQVARELEGRDPLDVADELTPDAERVAEIMPRTATEMQAVAVRAANFLKGKAPAAYRNPWTGRSFTSPAEADKFARYVEAVASPNAVWERLSDGTLTHEHVEAVREVYPRTYMEVQTMVYEHLRDLDDPPRYRARLAIGMLLGIETDPSLSAGHTAALDAALGPADPGPTESGGGPAPSEGTLNKAGAQQISTRAESLQPPHTGLERRTY